MANNTQHNLLTLINKTVEPQNWKKLIFYTRVNGTKAQFPANPKTKVDLEPKGIRYVEGQIVSKAKTKNGEDVLLWQTYTVAHSQHQLNFSFIIDPKSGKLMGGVTNTFFGGPSNFALMPAEDAYYKTYVSELINNPTFAWDEVQTM